MNDFSSPKTGAPTGEALVAYLRERGVDTELLTPGVPMPTVPLAAAAIGVTEDQIIKSLLFRDSRGDLVLAIASGTARIDRCSSRPQLDWTGRAWPTRQPSSP